MIVIIYSIVALCILYICSVIIGIVEAFQLKNELPYWWRANVFNSWIDECAAAVCIATVWPIFVIIGTFFAFVLLTKFLTMKIMSKQNRKQNDEENK